MKRIAAWLLTLGLVVLAAAPAMAADRPIVPTATVRALR